VTAARVERLRARLDELGAAAFLVTGGTNVRYLTGFESSNAALLVDPARVVLMTDGRYVEAARGLPEVELLLAERELAADLGARLSGLTRGPVAIEAEHVSVAEHAKIAESGVELVPAQKVVEGLRAVKDAGELGAVRRSARVLNEAYERLREERVVGRTEAELTWWLECLLHDLGAEALAFDLIVASGPNAALPHHHPGDRVVGPGETLLVDAGCVVDGYCSDCTRTFATGELLPELAEAYEVCRAAQVQALAAVRPGAAGREVDALARRVVAEAGYEVFHNLGHGVGLDVHEEPRLAATSTATLETANVVTVEPGVYLPGKGGIRIEDLVIVGPEGPEVLTPTTKELVVLD